MDGKRLFLPFGGRGGGTEKKSRGSPFKMLREEKEGGGRMAARFSWRWCLPRGEVDMTVCTSERSRAKGGKKSQFTHLQNF